jgi:hypothetical protein
MKLISSREAVSFLSQAAPRVWAQRMLRWMAFDEGLPAYSSRGKVQPHTTVGKILSEHYKEAGELAGPKLDRIIREQYEPNFAAKLIGRQHCERVDDDPTNWDESEEPRMLAIGFYMLAT